jgi:hypothetical protein
MYQQLGIDPDSSFPRMGDPAVRLTQMVGPDVPSGGRLKELV